MKNIPKLYLLATLLVLVSPFSTFAQPEPREYPPKKECKIPSVNDFVNQSFDIYNKAFVYDSLTQRGVEIPPEYEDIIIENVYNNGEQLYGIIPDILIDIGNAKVWHQAKAALNLNRARVALTESIKIGKKYSLGESTKPE